MQRQCAIHVQVSVAYRPLTLAKKRYCWANHRHILNCLQPGRDQWSLLFWCGFVRNRSGKE